MKGVIEYRLEDGTAVYVETQEPQKGSGMDRVGRSGETRITEAAVSFSEAFAHIRPAAEALLTTFREMNTPNEINLQFGLKMNAAAGAIFTSVGTEATFTVSLKWSNTKEPAKLPSETPPA